VALSRPAGAIPLPPPAAWPILTALAMLLLSVGALVPPGLVVLGALLTVLGVYRIALEHLPPAPGAAGHGIGDHDPHDAPDVNLGTTGLDHRKLGIWAFLGAECL